MLHKKKNFKYGYLYSESPKSKKIYIKKIANFCENILSLWKKWVIKINTVRLIHPWKKYMYQFKLIKKYDTEKVKKQITYHQYRLISTKKALP